MKLWLLKRHANVPVYDVADGFVVRATTAEEARRLATDQAGDEGASTWTDDRDSSCAELTADGPSKVVLRDFSAG